MNANKGFEKTFGFLAHALARVNLLTDTVMGKLDWTRSNEDTAALACIVLGLKERVADLLKTVPGAVVLSEKYESSPPKGNFHDAVDVYSALDEDRQKLLVGFVCEACTTWLAFERLSNHHTELRRRPDYEALCAGALLSFEQALGTHCFIAGCSPEEGLETMRETMCSFVEALKLGSASGGTFAEVIAESLFKTACGPDIRPIADSAWDFVRYLSRGNRSVTIDLKVDNEKSIACQMEETVRWHMSLLVTSDNPDRFKLFTAAIIGNLIENSKWLPPESRPREVSVTPSDDEGWRRCVRVLAMVHELHKAGYQRIRILPFLSPSGGYWRCFITTASNMQGDGYRPKDDDLDNRLGIVARYTSGQGADFFGWKDAKHLNARQLAKLFVERFPKIIEEGIGLDWAYAGWLTDVLGFAELGPDRGGLVHLIQDWPTDPDYLRRWQPPPVMR